LLAHYFLQRFAATMQKKVNTISETALLKLSKYHWPGNIRELENVLERAVNVMNGSVVLAEHIIFDHDYTPRQPALLPINQTLDSIVEAVERDVLIRSLQQHKSSRQLGKMLGLSHTAILKKLKKYNLHL
jgi:transcriptional regulator of aroF, aroG, tyrA and aromatic amino acid transport